MLNKDLKILILGSNGMLGKELASFLNEHNLVLWDQEDIDITQKDQVDTKIKELKPKIIINCAAYTAVDDCETNQKLAMDVNGKAVGYLASVSKDIGAILVYISTDYVFNGQNKEGYNEESDQFGPESVYGESKLLGEKELKDNHDKFYLIRISGLYGQYGNNFVKTMIKLGQERDELKIVNDQYFKPTYTVDLVKQILYILDNNLDFGTYHITNETKEGGITWYEFANEIFKIKDISVKAIPCTTDEYPVPAKRPAYSSLINTKLPTTSSWQEALKNYLNK